MNFVNATEKQFALRVFAPLAFFILGLLVGSSQAMASGEHHEDSIVELSDEAQSRATLSTAVAGPQKIVQQMTLYGRLLPEPTAVSHIRARYPGVVSRVNVHIGDEVKEGQVLATVHSNESLQEYQLRAPFAGMVTAKHAGPGEFVSNQKLFSVADFSRLWADLQVFPARMASVKKGQRVQIRAGDQSYNGTVRSLVPGDESSPYLRARVQVDNSDDRWVPGIFVEGRIIVAEVPVKVAVDNRALQELDGQPVVFVQTARNRFEARPVQLGAKGAAFTEIHAGIETDARYVVENSYMLKADLKKSAAGHAH
ncbi:efflux RND transporter periplasmic adaptor subunit [Microbulbifer sp.]|uniref:efflux RND transporter periplasmic adaptor subunit n=1 Tax=Microbulbifer sp. TaxID=1908541 RepID=UPI00258F6117|nr:efflux RND transporter periplasmic adaptor subunit [Microbulbifer sp.]